MTEVLEKRHTLALLLDLYGELLPPRQRQVLCLRLNEDMSWGEMAQDTKTTRQACEDAFSRGSKSLLRYEKVLGFMKTESDLRRFLRSMNSDNWESCRCRMLDLLGYNPLEGE